MRCLWRSCRPCSWAVALRGFGDYLLQNCHSYFFFYRQSFTTWSASFPYWCNANSSRSSYQSLSSTFFATAGRPGSFLFRCPGTLVYGQVSKGCFQGDCGSVIDPRSSWTAVAGSCLAPPIWILLLTACGSEIGYAETPPLPPHCRIRSFPDTLLLSALFWRFLGVEVAWIQIAPSTLHSIGCHWKHRQAL